MPWEGPNSRRQAEPSFQLVAAAPPPCIFEIAFRCFAFSTADESVPSDVPPSFARCLCCRCE